MFIVENQTALRLGIFISLFLLLGIIEYFFPRKVVSAQRIQRWGMHSALLVSAVLFSRVAIPIAAIEFAQICHEQHWGILYYVDLPFWLSCLLSLILLDLAIYGQHLFSHKWPLLWRFHRVHHSDKEMDVSTAIRFHPIEIAFSASYKLVCIALLGAPVLAVLLFEILLNAGALFSHSNIKLSSVWDRRLRYFIVTPDMHRIHHSSLQKETDSNYGFFVSVWDRIFSSYTDTPNEDYKSMTLGINTFTKKNTLKFSWAIILPFKK